MEAERKPWTQPTSIDEKGFVHSTGADAQLRILPSVMMIARFNMQRCMFTSDIDQMKAGTRRDVCLYSLVKNQTAKADANCPHHAMSVPHRLCLHRMLSLPHSLESECWFQMVKAAVLDESNVQSKIHPTLSRISHSRS